MELSFRQDNTLLVDGELMKAERDGSDRLLEVLCLGRLAIIGAIDQMYLRQYLIDLDYRKKTGCETAEVQRGSVFVMELCKNDIVLSGLGLFNAINKPINRGILEDPRELKPKYAPYWQSIELAELIPEARRVTYERENRIWLALRDTPLKVLD